MGEFITHNLRISKVTSCGIRTISKMPTFGIASPSDLYEDEVRKLAAVLVLGY